MSHEQVEAVNTLSQLCADQHVRTLIQVGAEDGYEAAVVAENIGCRSIAIEGNPRAKAFTSHIEYHHLIIGATDGITTFYLHNNGALSGHFPRGSNETAVQAPMQRLDTFCAIRGRLQPDAMIIDTEGSTMEVLEGCGRLLDGVNVVYAEVQGSEIRPGIRTVEQVDKLLAGFQLKRYEDPPTYGVGNGQFNQTYIRVGHGVG